MQQQKLYPQKVHYNNGNFKNVSMLKALETLIIEVYAKSNLNNTAMQLSLIIIQTSAFSIENSALKNFAVKLRGRIIVVSSS